MKKSLFIIALSALSMQVNAGFWKEVGKAMEVLNTVTGGTTATTVCPTYPRSRTKNQPSGD